MVSLTVLQAIAGLIATLLCRAHTAAARSAFALAKGMKRAGEQNRNLLYTLVPHNVVQHLATHVSSGDMPGADIPECTVMFCSLEPHDLLQSSFSNEAFDLINDVFSDFDAAVNRSGMFKYQHVGEWYIVACPRAAKAFDTAEQAAPYPSEYTVSMALLADELQAIARRYSTSDSRPLWLRVGINRGPVAGAVIGRHRAFYTLYGDTINTAARMCKYAAAAVHCTASFRDAVVAAGAAFLRCESRGERDIKGKGRMETFALSVDSETAERVRLGVYDGDGAAGARAASAKAAWRARLRPTTKKRLPPRLWSARVLSLRLWGTNEEGIDTVRDALKLAGGDEEAEEAMKGVSRLRAVLADPGLERRFLCSSVPALSGRLAATLTLRLAAVGCQWHMLASPEHEYDFAALGDPALEDAKAAARGILAAHFAGAAALTLLGLGLCAGRRTRLAQAVLVGTKLAHVGASVAAAFRLPAWWGWLVCFAGEFAVLDGLLCALPFRATLILNASLLVVLVAVVATLPVHSAGAAGYLAVFTLLLSLGGSLLSRATDMEERRRWLLGFRYQAELRKLRRMLFDLLPAKIARRMLEAGGRIPCEPGVAVVLQLDICRFTELSRAMAPMDVARMLHDVFSAFDAAVQERGLFKMDTIGDAYIVAGLLPPCDPGAPAGAHASEVRRVCASVLEVARAMLRAAAAYRRDGGRDVHCRIGISLGLVVTGVLGRLQPRLHLFGEGMRAAESHEQTGEADAVHVNHAFMRFLDRQGSGCDSESHGDSESQESCICRLAAPGPDVPTPSRHMGAGGHGWLAEMAADSGSGMYPAGGEDGPGAESGSEASGHVCSLTAAPPGPRDPAAAAALTEDSEAEPGSKRAGPAGRPGREEPLSLNVPGWDVVETVAPPATPGLIRPQPPRMGFGRITRRSQSSFVLYPGRDSERPAEQPEKRAGPDEAGTTAEPEPKPAEDRLQVSAGA